MADELPRPGRRLLIAWGFSAVPAQNRDWYLHSVEKGQRCRREFLVMNAIPVMCGEVALLVWSIATGRRPTLPIVAIVIAAALVAWAFTESGTRRLQHRSQVILARESRNVDQR